MTNLIITRGLPASGKTTWALTYQRTVPGTVRLSRDEMRQHLFQAQGVGTTQQETAISDLMHRHCRAYLENGIDVIIDATNLRLRHAREYATIAHEVGANFHVKDFDTDVDTCVGRDKERGHRGLREVGEQVIRDMHNRFRDRPEVTPRLKPDAIPVSKYTPPVTGPRAIIVDIDGTLAHMNGRSPYDWGKVGEDLPDENLRSIIQCLEPHYHILVVSGRDEKCRSITTDWLIDNSIPFDHLFMRPERDNRADTIIKYELFNRHIRDQYIVECVFDDRTQVVEHTWRAMGIPCYQVAPGNF